jgi:hypothetical protein
MKTRGGAPPKSPGRAGAQPRSRCCPRGLRPGSTGAAAPSNARLGGAALAVWRQVVVVAPPLLAVLLALVLVLLLLAVPLLRGGGGGRMRGALLAVTRTVGGSHSAPGLLPH